MQKGGAPSFGCRRRRRRSILSLSRCGRSRSSGLDLDAKARSGACPRAARTSLSVGRVARRLSTRRRQRRHAEEDDKEKGFGVVMVLVAVVVVVVIVAAVVAAELNRKHNPIRRWPPTDTCVGRGARVSCCLRCVAFEFTALCWPASS